MPRHLFRVTPTFPLLLALAAAAATSLWAENQTAR